MHSDDFAQLVARHYESLYKFAFSLTQAEADACALTQQTFHLWAAKGHPRRDQSTAKAWLFTTLHRVFTRRRRAGRAHHGLEEVPSEDLATSPVDAANALDAAQVLFALAKVDPIYRAAVALFYLEDFSYQEIGRVLDLPLGTVKSRIARGIAQLRELLGVGTPGPPEIAPNPVNRENLACDGSASDVGSANGYSAEQCG